MERVPVELTGCVRGRRDAFNVERFKECVRKRNSVLYIEYNTHPYFIIVLTSADTTRAQ
jgi:hypothetical protein